MIALIFRLLRFFGYTALVYLALLFAVANAGEGVPDPGSRTHQHSGGDCTSNRHRPTASGAIRGPRR